MKLSGLNRRNFLRTAGFAALTLPQPGIAGLSDLFTKKTNIIYILADDLGYGDISCYGQTKFTTPNIDMMASEGVKFTQHYAGSTVCAPSRCCLMTGYHTGHAFIRGNSEIQPEGQAAMPADTVTVAILLRNAGYRTGAFGKWGLGGPGTEGDPINQGFNEFFGYNCQRQAHNYYPDHLWHNKEMVQLDGKTYAHDLIVEQAMQFIEKNKNKPFFCYMPVTIPHAAMHVPEDSVAPFREKFPEFKDKIGSYAGPEVNNPIACFAGMVTRLDNQIGNLFKKLKELGIDENTLVIFTSDNGPHKEGGHDPEFFDSNGPLRGIKRDVYEGGIRVPMLARWPKKIAAGSVSDHISAFWDVLPTLTAIAGARTPGEIDGISFLPTLIGKPGKQKQHSYLYWEFHEQGGKQAIRINKWKAVRLDVGNNPENPIELYDLDNDIGETNNIADQHPKIIERVTELFKEARTQSDTFNFAPGPKPAKK